LQQFELYLWSYPLLFSVVVALFWSVVGENYLPVRFFNLTFTLATAVVLYYATRRELGKIPSFLATVTYLTSIEILVWSDQLLTQGLSSLFAILALAISRKNSYSGSIAGGIFAVLSVLAHYTNVAIAFPLLIAFVITNRNRPRLIAAAILGACIPTLAYEVAFPFAFPHFLDEYLGIGFVTPLPYYYYVSKWFAFFGIIGLFGLVALFLPSTYRSDSSRTWAFWLIGLLVLFTITGHKEDRYTFEWTPAVVYLSFLILTKIDNRLVSRDRSWTRNKSRSLPKLIFGAALVCLVVLQAYASVSAYLQLVESPGYYRDNNLLTVADYLKIHIPSNATFMSDYDAPALTYFSGRYGFAIYLPTSDSRFLEYLHNNMQSTHTHYLLAFPSLTGNSVSVLEDSGFLALADTIKVTSIGPVYFFISTT